MDALASEANRQLHSWQEVAHRLGGLSRSTVFKLWYDGELGSVTCGRRRFSTSRQLDEYIARLEGAA